MAATRQYPQNITNDPGGTDIATGFDNDDKEIKAILGSIESHVNATTSHNAGQISAPATGNLGAGSVLSQLAALESTKALKASIPTSLPANGGNADTATKASGTTFSITGTNGVGSYPSLLFYIPNVGWTDLYMGGDGDLRVVNHADGTTLKGFRAGNIYSNSKQVATIDQLSNVGIGNSVMTTQNPDLIKTTGDYYFTTAPNTPGQYFLTHSMGIGSDFSQFGITSSNTAHFRWGVNAWKQIATIDQIPTSLPANGGNSATVGGREPSIPASAYSIVQRDDRGYINNIWFCSTRSSENLTAASYIFDVGDGYMRKKDLENVRQEIWDTAHSFSGNGYQKLANGLIIQWCSTTFGGNNAIGEGTESNTINFPLAFPNGCLLALPGMKDPALTPFAPFTCSVVGETNTSFKVRIKNVSGVALSSFPVTVRVIAIGY